LPEAWQSTPVSVNGSGSGGLGSVLLVEADVVAEENRYRHDPQKLAATVVRLYYERDSIAAGNGRQPAEQSVLLTR
jgi:hypothetical protein